MIKSSSLIAGVVLAGVLTATPMAATAASSSPKTDSGTATIALTAPSGMTGLQAYSTGMPGLGQYVAFATSYSGNIKTPLVEVDCYQSTQLVWAVIQDSTTNFQLGGGSSPWTATGGAATCNASIEYFLWKGNTEVGKVVLASTAFDAS